MLHAQEHAEHVGIEGGGVTLRGLFGDRAGRALGAGVIDVNVEAAELRDGLADQILHVVLVADVGANEFRFCAKAAKFADKRLAGVIAAAGDDYSGAFVREGQSGGAADAGQGAGNQYNGIAHATSPSKRLGMPVGPFTSCQFRAAGLLDEAVSVAIAGDVEKAGAREKDFVGSEPYF